MSRPLVGPRLRRVLALVPWILAHPGVTLAELAERFEVSERELERDLELLPMCGLPPYTADRLIDV
ncbi:MAG: HTH domain-containing protein, partial [Acidimicrobiia bacterium]